ncbi:MAG: 16S rRNA (guanine(966)-N(2))-methyltransferase RsmD [Campylobacterota bacterium]|nr:16S rRNA (guanine(966)-N(2))-methyltransferase RsmD [Campylobacterota bacterium]
MRKSSVVTKIIGGKYKGKILELPSLEVTRSSKSILKESFFNVLQFDIIDTLFIEGFGGSGGIGLEALSRGAKHSYFCEINRQSYRTLQKNCDSLDPASCTTLYGDTFEKLPNLLEQLKNQKSVNSNDIIIYLDPPFDFRDGMEDVYEKTFNLVKDIKNEKVILITFEHVTGLELPEAIGRFTKFKTKKFGKSSLTYYNV